MSKIFKNSSDKLYMNGNHKQYLSRITKTLYYGKLPKTDCLSWPVTEFAAEIFSEAKKGKSLDRLHGYKAAEISRNACVAPCSLVLALLYLDRLKNRNPQYLEKICPSDLFLVSLMVSCKFLFDDGEGDEVFLDEWAASGGVTIKELVRLEKEFLSAINWEIFVSDNKFYHKLRELELILALKQGTTRGNFTYTELDVTSPIIELHKIIQCLTAVTVILALTYVAGFLTIVGSVFLTSQIPGTSLYVKKVEKDTSVAPINTEDLVSGVNKSRSRGVVDMLKTSILLASINNSYRDESDVQSGSWDYWNNPVMEWLAKSSQIITDLTAKDLPYYLPFNGISAKYIQFDDKASRSRIHLESSWHVEWIQSIKIGYYKNVKLR